MLDWRRNPFHQPAGGRSLSPPAAWARAEDLLPEILAQMHRQADSPGVLGRAARHHFGAGGKAFRATLLAACAGQLGVTEATAIPAAAACELLHNASLIHDDLHDGDTLRRGAPTVWRRFGADVAVYLGDHFIAQAFALLARAGDGDKVGRLVEAFASTVRTAVRGQLSESAFDYRDRQAPDTYHDMAAGKSGALFALPAHLACLLADADDDLTAATRRILEHYGVAYQIKDDLLDLLGGKEGRPAGSDLAAGKANAGLVLHLAAADPALADRLVGDLQSGLHPRRRAWWLNELTQPAVLARAAREHANLLTEAERLAPQLPRPLWETLRFGLARVVELPAPLECRNYDCEEVT